jgi:hypothetical protein
MSAVTSSEPPTLRYRVPRPTPDATQDETQEAWDLRLPPTSSTALILICNILQQVCECWNVQSIIVLSLYLRIDIVLHCHFLIKSVCWPSWRRCYIQWCCARNTDSYRMRGSATCYQIRWRNIHSPTKFDVCIRCRRPCPLWPCIQGRLALSSPHRTHCDWLQLHRLHVHQAILH